MIDPRREYLDLMRRMPFAEAKRLHNDFGIPWLAIKVTCPVPTRVRFLDKPRSLFEPDEHGMALWVLPVCVAIRAVRGNRGVSPTGVVSKGAIVDLVAFHPHGHNQFARRIGKAIVLGAVPPQYMEPAPVLVFSDVTDWLRAGCNGIVLLNNDGHQRGRILREISSIEARSQPK